MLSADGHCYAFDRRANGLVPGEAVAVVEVPVVAVEEAVNAAVGLVKVEEEAVDLIDQRNNRINKIQTKKESQRKQNLWLLRRLSRSLGSPFPLLSLH